MTGPGGLLKALTKTVIETALDEEMAEHLGYDKHDPVGRNRGNSRNGKRSKTVLTDSGEVEIEVPRDRDGTFEPVIVAKRQRRLSDIDEMVLSLYAKRVDHRGDRRPLRRGVRRAGVQGHHLPDHRPGDRGDAGLVQPPAGARSTRRSSSTRSWSRSATGRSANRPVYAAIGVDLDGHKDILGMWAGDGGGESAKFWMAVLTELRNRGVADVFFVVCDGLKGLPDSRRTRSGRWPPCKPASST